MRVITLIRDKITRLYFKLRGEDFIPQYKTIKSIVEEGDIDSFVEKSLRDLLIHAYRNVPYYKRIFDDIGLVSGNHVDISRFSEVPILTKNIIRQHIDELKSMDFQRRKFYYNSSGGSTGEPVTFIQDAEYKAWARATVHFYYKDVLGIDDLKARKVIIWGAEREFWDKLHRLRGRIENWFTRTKLLNAFRMTREDMLRFVKIINRFRPHIIRGYATSLYDFARFIDNMGIEIHSAKVVISTAETLYDFMRKKLEEVFCADVRDFYGSRESSALGGECHRNMIHMFAFNNYVELLDVGWSKKNVRRIIVTTLHNYSMPLIRYDIGDLAETNGYKCSCDLLLPAIKRVYGRVSDNFILPDGTVVHGEYFVHLFYFREWVRKFQVIQEDYDKIRIKVIVNEDKAGEGMRKDIAEIEHKIRLVMGENAKISWEFVEEIHPPPSGKHLFTFSLMYRREQK